jgi:hypothetical protein
MHPPQPAGSIVGVAGDEGRIGAGGDTTWARVGAAAVGAYIDIRRLAVGGVVLAGRVAYAGPGLATGGRTQFARAGGIVEALAQG